MGTLRTLCPLSPALAAVRDHSVHNITHRWMQATVQAPHTGPRRGHWINPISLGSQGWASIQTKQNKKKSPIHLHEPTLNSILPQHEEICHHLWIKKEKIDMFSLSFLPFFHHHHGAELPWLPPRSYVGQIPVSIQTFTSNMFHK